MAEVPEVKSDPDAVLSKATLKASALLGLSNAELAKVLGISRPSVSRIASGSRHIDSLSREGEMALILVRIFRSLDQLVGGDSCRRTAWMTSHNKAIADSNPDHAWPSTHHRLPRRHITVLAVVHNAV